VHSFGQYQYIGSNQGSSFNTAERV